MALSLLLLSSSLNCLLEARKTEKGGKVWNLADRSVIPEKERGLPLDGRHKGSDFILLFQLEVFFGREKFQGSGLTLFLHLTGGNSKLERKKENRINLVWENYQGNFFEFIKKLQLLLEIIFKSRGRFFQILEGLLFSHDGLKINLPN